MCFTEEVAHKKFPCCSPSTIINIHCRGPHDIKLSSQSGMMKLPYGGKLSEQLMSIHDNLFCCTDPWSSYINLLR